MAKDTAELVEEKTMEIVPSTPHSVIIAPDTLQAQIEMEKKTRKIVSDYIKSELKAEVDFGKVMGKDTLLKPGTEKLCNIFHLRPTFEKDEDTWEMSGKIPGLYCYVCKLVNTNGEVVGEGRGAANKAEKSSSKLADNIAVKIAQKRAQTDAVLRTISLSDVFTQDIEDMKDEIAPISKPTYQATNVPKAKPKMTLEMYQSNINNAATVDQLNKIKTEIIADSALPGVIKFQLQDAIKNRLNQIGSTQTAPVSAEDMPF